MIEYFKNYLNSFEMSPFLKKNPQNVIDLHKKIKNSLLDTMKWEIGIVDYALSLDLHKEQSITLPTIHSYNEIKRLRQLVESSYMNHIFKLEEIESKFFGGLNNQAPKTK